ncbi:MAG: hypothetical protein FP813_07080 [Desulfurivibrio sp.]|nr:hypothetical protein [Desulfurivibrio sp.]MBU3936132.1 hypothetical protein [Pseudomonadota bacterium]MBU4118778.1 hypothetical protein [Pseudomonadota bacterium]
MTPEQVSLAANWSTIVACIVAVFALVLGARQFVETQKASREYQAVELFLKFNQLNIEQALSSNLESDHWYNNSKFAITESLFEIAHKSESWASTIRWMLEQQEDFIRSGNFDVETYTKRFRDFCENHNCEIRP